LLRQGLAILTEKGFSAVGIDEILTAAKVPKGSFYYYFDNKEALGLALIDAYNDYFAAKLDRWFSDETLSPLERVRAFMANARDGMERYEFRRGCLVGNLGQEMGVLTEPFRDRLIEVLQGWEERTANCFRAAQEAGELSAETDCVRLAQFFWTGWEGAVLRAKLEHKPDPLDVFSETFLAMIAPKTNVRQHDGEI
jgi:TetR/AcrR family transcriptional repressor of nem operon